MQAASSWGTLLRLLQGEECSERELSGTRHRFLHLAGYSWGRECSIKPGHSLTKTNSVGRIPHGSTMTIQLREENREGSPCDLGQAVRSLTHSHMEQPHNPDATSSSSKPSCPQRQAQKVGRRDCGTMSKLDKKNPQPTRVRMAEPGTAAPHLTVAVYNPLLSPHFQRLFFAFHFCFVGKAGPEAIHIGK